MDKSGVKSLHDRVLSLVDRALGEIEIKESIDERTSKVLESLDKIVRSALELKAKELPESEVAGKSDEELSEEFE